MVEWGTVLRVIKLNFLHAEIWDLQPALRYSSMLEVTFIPSMHETKDSSEEMELLSE